MAVYLEEKRSLLTLVMSFMSYITQQQAARPGLINRDRGQDDIPSEKQLIKLALQRKGIYGKWMVELRIK